MVDHCLVTLIKCFVFFFSFSPDFTIQQVKNLRLCQTKQKYNNFLQHGLGKIINSLSKIIHRYYLCFIIQIHFVCILVFRVPLKIHNCIYKKDVKERQHHLSMGQKFIQVCWMDTFGIFNLNLYLIIVRSYVIQKRSLFSEMDHNPWFAIQQME